MQNDLVQFRQAWVKGRVRNGGSASVLNVPEPDVNIYGLVRVGKEEHLKEFSTGRLRFRSLEYYQSQEHSAKGWHDPNEGVSGIFQVEQCQVTVRPEGEEPKAITPEAGIPGRLMLKARRPRLRVLCFHTIHAGAMSHTSFPEEEVPGFRRNLEIKPSLLEHGSHVWFLRDFEQFSERLKRAAMSRGYGLQGHLVRYVDFEKTNGVFPERLIGFIKSNEFEEEREYRLILTVPPDAPELIHLELGNLEDVGTIMPLDEFNRAFEVHFYDNE